MSRDTKFRGRRKDKGDSPHNGSWVYGHYFIAPLTDENSGLPAESGWFFLSGGTAMHCIEQNGVVFVIDEETRGQYTGLKDKNDVEIYEGDVVIDEGNQKWRSSPVIGTVQYSAPTFYVVTTDGQRDSLDSMWEVIGNIYENADLLAGTVSK